MSSKRQEREERCTSTTARRSAVQACAASEHLRANRKHPRAHKGKEGAGGRLTAEPQSVRARQGTRRVFCSQVDGMQAASWASLHAECSTSLQNPCHCALMLMVDAILASGVLPPPYHGTGSMRRATARGSARRISHTIRPEDGVSDIITVDYRPRRPALS
jgi:hypothetical protein